MILFSSLAAPQFLDFSDDEQEKRAKAKWRDRNKDKEVSRFFILETSMNGKTCLIYLTRCNKLWSYMGAGMHLGCAIGQMAHKNCHGRTFWKTVRPAGRIVFPSGAYFKMCAPEFSNFLYIFKIFQVHQRQGNSGNFEIPFIKSGKSTFRIKQGKIRDFHYE